MLKPDDYFNSSDDQTNNGSGRFFNHRRWFPQYDDEADYNTNSKSYYDFLARFIRYLDYITEYINKLLRRRVAVKDTTTVDMSQDGDWETQDVTTLSAEVKLSKQTEHDDVAKADLPNAIGVKNDGLYARDYSAIIDLIVKSIAGSGKIEVPRKIDTSGDSKLINGVDLGDVTDDTRVGITWHMGSTRQTSYYTVGDLKTTNSHIYAYNMLDGSNGNYFAEIYTRVFGSTLKITNVKIQTIFSNPNWITTPPEMTQFYDKSNPDYVNKANNQDVAIDVDYITVYDLVPIFPEK